MEGWYLLITKKVLFWTLRRWKIRSFLESKCWWKDDICWLRKSSCFELFGDRKYCLFLSQKVDGKMIFTWPFLVFHDIPGHGKYGSPCSDTRKNLPHESQICYHKLLWAKYTYKSYRLNSKKAKNKEQIILFLFGVTTDLRCWLISHEKGKLDLEKWKSKIICSQMLKFSCTNLRQWEVYVL